MSFGTDYPTPERYAQDTPVKAARGWLPQVIVWASVAYAAYLTVESLAGAGFSTGVTGVIGSVFLLLVLVPSNLLRFRWWSRKPALRAPLRFLARLRKPLGVSAGIWFVTHTVVGFAEFFDFSSLGSLARQTLIGDIAVGLLATLIFVALLLTSTGAAQRRLGRNWKLLQRLVWVAVPLSLAHIALSSAALAPRTAGHLPLHPDNALRRLRVVRHPAQAGREGRFVDARGARRSGAGPLGRDLRGLLGHCRPLGPLERQLPRPSPRQRPRGGLPGAPGGVPLSLGGV